MVFIPTSHRLTKSSIGSITRALEATLADYPNDNDLANGEAWL